MTTVVAQGSALALPFPDSSIPCVVTSPPYNVGIPYEGYDDTKPWEAYNEGLVRPAMYEIARVLDWGGRAWINVPTNAPWEAWSSERNDARMDVSYLWKGAAYLAGLHYRDTIVWHKGRGDGGTAWGSWLSPTAPNIRGAYEVVLCLYKGAWERAAPKGWPGPRGQEQMMPRVALGGDWTDLVTNIWEIQPDRHRHGPAPFPLDLPARCIRLSTWPGEVVLDPFGGTGTTAEAASILGRVGISMDISEVQTKQTHARLQTLF